MGQGLIFTCQLIHLLLYVSAVSYGWINWYDKESSMDYCKNIMGGLIGSLIVELATKLIDGLIGAIG